MISDKRAKELLQQIIAWACEHDDQLVVDMFDSTDITAKEAADLDLDEYPIGIIDTETSDLAARDCAEWSDALDKLEALKDDLGDIDAYIWFNDQLNSIHRGDNLSYSCYADALADAEAFAKQQREKNREK